MAFLYASAGAVGLASTLLPAASGRAPHPLWLMVEDGAAVLVAPCFLRMRRIRLWVVGSATVLATAMVTVRVYLWGDSTMASTSATLYLLIVLPGFFLYSRALAWSQGAGVGVLALVLLHGNRLLGTAELVLGTGVAAILAAVANWLVRASDLAENDYRTGLMNWRGFETAAQRVIRCADHARPPVLVVIDLDGVDVLHERRRYAASERELYSISQRWRQDVPAGAILSRQHGGKFALLMTGASLEEAERTLGAMRTAAATMTFNAGLAQWSPEESLAMLMLRADAAVYEAKRRGPEQSLVADPPVSVRHGQDVIDALATGQFTLHYQPIVDLRTEVVDKAEALLRWNHPTQGTISPDEFIPLAEQTGVMIELGDWVLATACRDAADWTSNADALPISVSINASAVELQDPTYAQRALGHMRDAALSTDRVVIEVVETNYNLNSPTVRQNLAVLAAAGVSLAIDDFGTGYSSLSRLDQMDVQVLKIDRSFVRTLTHPSQQMPVITAILALARALGLQVVAEGVETPMQALWLRSRGCSHAQGYLYGKPAPNPSRINVKKVYAR